MNPMGPRMVVLQAVYSLFTLYMLLILLSWFGPWLQLDLHGGRFRWIRLLTEPLIERLRRLLPPMGPIDFGPVAALFLVWLVRTFAVNLVALNMR